MDNGPPMSLLLAKKAALTARGGAESFLQISLCVDILRDCKSARQGWGRTDEK